MWYFSWILGLSLASAFGVLNALWLEVAPDDARPTDEAAPPSESPPRAAR